MRLSRLVNIQAIFLTLVWTSSPDYLRDALKTGKERGETESAQKQTETIFFKSRFRHTTPFAKTGIDRNYNPRVRISRILFPATRLDVPRRIKRLSAAFVLFAPVHFGYSLASSAPFEQSDERLLDLPGEWSVPGWSALTVST